MMHWSLVCISGQQIVSTRCRRWVFVKTLLSFVLHCLSSGQGTSSFVQN